MTKTFNIISSIVVFFAVFIGVQFAYGSISLRIPTLQNEVQTFTFFSATTTAATSSNAVGGTMNVKGAKKIEILFSRGDTSGQGNLGQSMFRVQGSTDFGVSWSDVGRLILASSTSQTGQQTVFVSGTSSTMVSVDLRTDTYTDLRCTVWEVTDGEHTCKGLIEF